jgi:hypothetical protein
MRNRIARSLAWVLALALLAYLFHRSSPAEVARAVKQAAPWTVPVLAGLVVVVYLADSLAMWRIFGWFVARLSFREVLVVRGATYLLAIINYTVGQATIVYFVNRSRGVPVTRGAAAVLLVMGTNVLLLLFFTTAGLAIAPEVPRLLPTVVGIAWAGLAVYIVAVALRPRWLTDRPIFDVLLGAGVGGHLKAVAVRVPHLLSLILYTYVSMRAFGIRVPVQHAFACLPVVFFISVLPISPAGLGTMQMAMTLFFARYASGATILASSLTSQAVAVGVQSLLGLACLRNQMARGLPVRSPP